MPRTAVLLLTIVTLFAMAQSAIASDRCSRRLCSSPETVIGFVDGLMDLIVVPGGDEPIWSDPGTIMSPNFSRYGRLVAYRTIHDELDTIMLVDLWTGTQTIIDKQVEPAWVMSPVISPDGSLLAYINWGELWLCDISDPANPATLHKVDGDLRYGVRSVSWLDERTLLYATLPPLVTDGPWVEPEGHSIRTADIWDPQENWEIVPNTGEDIWHPVIWNNVLLYNVRSAAGRWTLYRADAWEQDEGSPLVVWHKNPDTDELEKVICAGHKPMFDPLEEGRYVYYGTDLYTSGAIPHIVKLDLVTMVEEEVELPTTRPVSEVATYIEWARSERIFRTQRPISISPPSQPDPEQSALPTSRIQRRER